MNSQNWADGDSRGLEPAIQESTETKLFVNKRVVESSGSYSGQCARALYRYCGLGSHRMCVLSKEGSHNHYCCLCYKTKGYAKGKRKGKPVRSSGRTSHYPRARDIITHSRLIMCRGSCGRGPRGQEDASVLWLLQKAFVP